MQEIGQKSVQLQTNAAARIQLLNERLQGFQGCQMQMRLFCGR
jgi:hypothetical protein